MCRCVSIIPGITMPPVASISVVPSGTSRCGPTASIRSPLTSTSPPWCTVCASSMVSTVAFRNTRVMADLHFEAGRRCMQLSGLATDSCPHNGLQELVRKRGWFTD